MYAGRGILQDAPTYYTGYIATPSTAWLCVGDDPPSWGRLGYAENVIWTTDIPVCQLVAAGFHACRNHNQTVGNHRGLPLHNMVFGRQTFLYVEIA